MWLPVLICVLTKYTLCASDNTCTYTQDGQDGVHADCSHRQMTSLPTTWPADVVWLDMSHNQLTGLTNLAHVHLANLRHLDLSHNQMNDTIANDTFAPLQQLRWLSLQGNCLRSLQAGAMTGLVQMTFLDMANNQLQLDYHTYPPGVFHPLTSLEELNLAGNDDRYLGKYPEEIFRPLSNLHTLTIDTFIDSHFGDGFSTMRHLKTLVLPDSKLHTITNTTFKAFQNSSLESISILAAPDLTKVETCAFCSLPFLTNLRIVDVGYLPLLIGLEALYGLQNQTMELIDFTGMQRSLPTSTVDKHATRYLQNICVAKFVVRGAHIEWVTPSAFGAYDKLLGQCLQEIDASENAIWGDPGALYIWLNLPNLRSFTLANQHIHSVESAALQTGRDTNVDFHQFVSFIFYVSPTLQHLNLSAGMRSMSGENHVLHASNLLTLDISNCRLHNCIAVQSGNNSLQTVDLSGSYCYNISDTFFDHGTALRHLRLSKFNVDPNFFRARAGRLFQNMKLLQTLDLSLNDLIHVDLHMLRAQQHLKELNLAGNRLQSLSVDLEPHKDLHLLDVSNNMLPTLLPHERQVLDTLVATHSLSLRLQGNPLQCTCSTLDFVRWLWTTKVQLDGEGGSAGNYTCVTESAEVSDTHSVMVQYDAHWRRCVGQGMLTVASVAFSLQMLALVTVYMVSRSWTHIRYAWKVMQQLRLPSRENFRRDAYLGYADADWELACLTLTACLEERHGLRLLLRDREELPGSIRAESIVEHIDGSWKVLLLVTRHFATDEWACGFTVQQAQRSITDTMPDRVIVVFLEDPARLPPMASLERLLRMVPEKNVLHAYTDMPPYRATWDRVADMIVAGDKAQR